MIDIPEPIKQPSFSPTFPQQFASKITFGILLFAGAFIAFLGISVLIRSELISYKDFNDYEKYTNLIYSQAGTLFDVVIVKVAVPIIMLAIGFILRGEIDK